MASALRIIDLNGRAINIIKGSHQKWADVVKKANLPKRFDFCLRHWMSEDPLDIVAEERVKGYLDRVGYILIQDKPDGKIITDYKEIRDRVALIPISCIPQLENMFYGSSDESSGGFNPNYEDTEHMTRREKKIYGSLVEPRVTNKSINARAERRKRIDSMRLAHPDATVAFVLVDTDNCFRFDGRRYRIDDIPQYRPKDVRGDLLYDMDQVICVSDASDVYFYDQEFNTLDGHVDAV